MKDKIYSFSIVFVCLLIFSLLAHNSYGQQTNSEPLRYELFEHKLFVVHTKNDTATNSITKTDSMRYRLLFPKNYDPKKSYFKRYPLVLYLHGAGERGDSSLTVKHIGAWALQEKNRDNYECFVLVPQCEKDNKWVEVDWAADSHTQPKEMSKYMSLTVQLLEKLEKQFPIDTDRIYLTGLSMGGYGTWDLATRFPKKFAAIVPICGGADEKTATSLKSMPIWVFHGALDQTVKPQRSRNMVEAVKKKGNKDIHYTEYEKVKHASWKPAYEDESMWKWLFEKKSELERESVFEVDEDGFKPRGTVKVTHFNSNHGGGDLLVTKGTRYKLVIEGDMELHIQIMDSKRNVLFDYYPKVDTKEKVIMIDEIKEMSIYYVKVSHKNNIDIFPIIKVFFKRD